MSLRYPIMTALKPVTVQMARRRSPPRKRGPEKTQPFTQNVTFFIPKCIAKTTFSSPPERGQSRQLLYRADWLPASSTNPSPTGLVSAMNPSQDDHRTARLTLASTLSERRVRNGVMIGAFIIRGSESKTVMIRLIGPSLSQFGVANALSDPTLELHDSSGAIIATTITGGHTTACYATIIGD